MNIVFTGIVIILVFTLLFTAYHALQYVNKKDNPDKSGYEVERHNRLASVSGISSMALAGILVLISMMHGM